MTEETRIEPKDRVAYENRICLFLDVLGFQDFIDKKGDKEVAERASGLFTLLASFGKTESWAKTLDFVATQFSDCLVLSFRAQQKDSCLGDQAPQYQFVGHLHALLMAIVGKRFLVRGGMAMGKLFHDQGGPIFGKALNHAYELEKAADYPRILTNKVVRDALVPTVIGERSDFARSLFHEEPSGLVSINYLSYEQIGSMVRTSDNRIFEFYAALREILIEGLKHPKIAVKNKYDWAVAKYVESIDALARPEDRGGYFSPIQQRKFRQLRSFKELPELNRRLVAHPSFCTGMEFVPAAEGTRGIKAMDVVWVDPFGRPEVFKEVLAAFESDSVAGRSG